MKKLLFSLVMVMTLLTSMFETTLATSPNFDDEVGTLSEAPTFEDLAEKDNQVTSDVKVEATDKVKGAGKKIIGNMTKKDRKIKEYTDKYNNSTNAYVAYYLELIQLYSIPVCVIGIAIGAFNFYIIGDKKLDKKEQGFGFIMSFLCGLVFFQVLPFIFALLVAGK